MPDLQLMTSYAGAHLKTPNRVAMAPMTRNRAGEERCPNELMGTYYCQRASAGLLISEAVDVSERAVGYPGTPGIYRADQRDGWSALVDQVREAQPEPAPFFLQLFHTGRVSHPSVRSDGSAPVGPSAVAAKVQLYTPTGLHDAAMPEAMSVQVIDETVAEFVAAGKAAVAAGFDGVEVNAGNGYLVDQFLRDGANHRTDGYGGSVRNRIRFLEEVVDGLAAAIGAERVAVRVSPVNPTNDIADSDPEALFTAVAEVLESKGLAYLHVIENADSCRITPAIRERFTGTLVVNDGYDRDKAEKALASGLADIVSFGRAFLANPDLPRRLAEGAPLNEPDAATFYGGSDEGYTSYPSL